MKLCGSRPSRAASHHVLAATIVRHRTEQGPLARNARRRSRVLGSGLEGVIAGRKNQRRLLQLAPWRGTTGGMGRDGPRGVRPGGRL